MFLTEPRYVNVKVINVVLIKDNKREPLAARISSRSRADQRPLALSAVTRGRDNSLNVPLRTRCWTILLDVGPMAYEHRTVNNVENRPDLIYGSTPSECPKICELEAVGIWAVSIVCRRPKVEMCWRRLAKSCKPVGAASHISICSIPREAGDRR